MKVIKCKIYKMYTNPFSMDYVLMYVDDDYKVMSEKEADEVIKRDLQKP